MKHLFVLVCAFLSVPIFAGQTHEVQVFETSVGPRSTGYLGWKHPDDKKKATYSDDMHKGLEVQALPPESFDWRAAGIVTPVRDQGSCGSCWAMGMVKALESVMAIHKSDMGKDLSEQEMVSCNKDAYGCDGGFMTSAGYLVSRGVASEKSFPYVARDVACKQEPVEGKASKYVLLGSARRSPTVLEIKQALVEHGPLFITVIAGGSGWSGKKKEVTSCRKRGTTNHIVTLVGYDKKGWIIRNSWGTSWADKGDAHIKFGCDKIGDEAGYVTVN